MSVDRPTEVLPIYFSGLHRQSCFGVVHGAARLCMGFPEPQALDPQVYYWKPPPSLYFASISLLRLAILARAQESPAVTCLSQGRAGPWEAAEALQTAVVLR